MSTYCVSNSDLQVQRKKISAAVESACRIESLEATRSIKLKIELIQQQATAVEAELKAVSFTLTEFEAMQTGSKRQEVTRKEIRRLMRLQTQRKAEIESLEVCAPVVNPS